MKVQTNNFSMLLTGSVWGCLAHFIVKETTIKKETAIKVYITLLSFGRSSQCPLLLGVCI